MSEHNSDPDAAANPDPDQTVRMDAEQAEAGWYPDPDDPRDLMLRFWDGSSWTEHRSAPADAGGEPSSPPPGATPPSQFSTTPVSDDERRNILAQQIQASAVRGLRVENQDRFQAILIEGQPINHVLHVILTLVTCGLWGIVWIIIVATGGEKRHLITVDEYGNVVHQQLGRV